KARTSRRMTRTSAISRQCPAILKEKEYCASSREVMLYRHVRIVCLRIFLCESIRDQQAHLPGRPLVGPGDSIFLHAVLSLPRQTLTWAGRHSSASRSATRTSAIHVVFHAIETRLHFVCSCRSVKKRNWNFSA